MSELEEWEVHRERERLAVHAAKKYIVWFARALDRANQRALEAGNPRGLCDIVDEHGQPAQDHETTFVLKLASQLLACLDEVPGLPPPDELLMTPGGYDPLQEGPDDRGDE